MSGPLDKDRLFDLVSHMIAENRGRSGNVFICMHQGAGGAIDQLLIYATDDGAEEILSNLPSHEVEGFTFTPDSESGKPQ